jgi:hypothetical protein
MSKIAAVAQDSADILGHLPSLAVSVGLWDRYGHIFVILLIQILQSLFNCLLLFGGSIDEVAIPAAFSRRRLDCGDWACDGNVSPAGLRSARREGRREHFY